jgi:hypothetical protein
MVEVLVKKYRWEEVPVLGSLGRETPVNTFI